MSGNDVNIVISDLRTDALKIMNDFCVLPYATFDGISAGLGADDSYEDTHEQMTTLLSGGVTETASIATNLRATADNMVATDQAAADNQGP